MEENESTQIIRTGVAADSAREDIKRELISHGLGTVGFAETYAAILKELGKKEPAPKVPDFVSVVSNKEYNVSPSTGSTELPSIPKMLQTALTITVQSWQAVLTTSIILAFASFVPVLLATFITNIPVLLVLIITTLAYVVTFLAFGALFFVIAKNKERMTYEEAFRFAAGNFVALLWLHIFSALVVVGGSTLLIIPGVLILVYSIFAFLVFIHENATGSRALVRSFDLVQGAFVPLLIRTLCVVLIAFLLGVLTYVLVGALIDSPLSIPATILGALTYTLAYAFAFAGLASLYEARRNAKPLFDLSSYSLLKWGYRLLFLIGVAVVTIILVVSNVIIVFLNSPLFSEFESVQTQNSQEFDEAATENEAFNVADFLMEQKVKATAVSAKISGGRMGSYEGACNDIIVEEPVVCRSTGMEFVVYGPMVAGDIYCVDSTDFSGRVTLPNALSCQ